MGLGPPSRPILDMAIDRRCYIKCDRRLTQIYGTASATTTATTIATAAATVTITTTTAATNYYHNIATTTIATATTVATKDLRVSLISPDHLNITIPIR